MKSYIKKVHRYGTRRLMVRLIILLFCNLRALWFKYFFSDNTPKLRNTKVIQPTQFVGKGHISVGAAQLGVWPSPGLANEVGYIEARSERATVQISDSVFLNNSFNIMCDRSSITIGARCLIGPRFFVTDSDFHGIELIDRLNGNYECEPVVLGEDIFVGANVAIFKGVQIGNGAVIGSGSVVVNNVPSKAVFAGVPAKLVRMID